MMTHTERDEVEALVDRHSMYDLLAILSEVAYLKAEHVSEAWQDDKLAREWRRAGLRIDRCAAAMSVVPGIGRR